MESAIVNGVCVKRDREVLDALLCKVTQELVDETLKCRQVFQKVNELIDRGETDLGTAALLFRDRYKDIPVCLFCARRLAGLICSRKCGARYCSRDCQVQAWPAHKGLCR